MIETINHSVRENLLKLTGIISTFEALSNYPSITYVIYYYVYEKILDLTGNTHSFAASCTEPKSMIYTINYSFETFST